MRLLRKLSRFAAAPALAADPPGPAPHFTSIARSHHGAVRELNEDRFVDLPEFGLWAVADGMGGHQAGDVAAQMTADSLAGLASGGAVPTPGDVIEAVEAVNAALLTRGAAGGGGTSGTTLVSLLIDEAGYTCLWVGDSRAYLFRDGMLTRISRDHSLVQEMVDAGVLSPEQARVHPRAHVITRAVGVADPIRLEAIAGSIEPGDIFLLCSDGLTGALEESEIEAFLAAGEPVGAADAMLAASLANRARDNVTLVLVEVLR
ncbi:MAG: serine/threonine protein phosphatase [Alphaproteobacteria bacterium]|nr:serine/threonine protein phosphatase [Alphaproteobacteria bacterium]